MTRMKARSVSRQNAGLETGTPMIIEKTSIISMKSKYNGKCSRCLNPIQVGATIRWDTETKKAWHPKCENKSEAKPKKNKKKLKGVVTRPAKGNVRFVS